MTTPNTDSTLREQLLDILKWYGEQFDPQGWEVDERFEAVDKIESIIALKVQEARIDLANFKPEGLPKNAMNIESVKQGINYYSKQLKKQALQKTKGE